MLFVKMFFLYPFYCGWWK